MSRTLPYVLGLVVVAGMALPSPAAAVLKVFACEPEWAALAREIGGDKVEAFSATHAKQDPHYIRARPSLIARIRRADLVFCAGAGLEIGWLPLLMQRGARSGVQPGQPGHLMATDHVPMLEKPVVVDRSLGDVHPDGNPHVHLDPRNILRIAQELGRRLQLLDAASAGYYKVRLTRFEIHWTAAMTVWKTRAARILGMPVVVHHKSFSYLLRWTGLAEKGTLEVKPGIPPTASHLNQLLQVAKAAQVKAILRTPYDPPAPSEWLSARTGIPALILPFTVEKDAKSGALHDLFESLLAILERAHARS